MGQREEGGHQRQRVGLGKPIRGEGPLEFLELCGRRIVRRKLQHLLYMCNHGIQRTILVIGRRLIRDPDPAFPVCVARGRTDRRVPPRAREVFVLHDMEGYKHHEIAEMLDIPIGTVMSRLHRGRKALQRKLWNLAEAKGLTGTTQ